MRAVIRADAGPQIGLGHVMRCLALAQAWRAEGGEVSFLTATDLPVLRPRLEVEGDLQILQASPPGGFADAQETALVVQEIGARWVVLDGYHFTAGFQRLIKDGGSRLIVIDDYGHAAPYRADFILNQNMHAHERLYGDREDYTRLLLGCRYALLRREYWSWQGWRREIFETSSKILVTLGGADPNRVTLKVLEALKQVKADDLEITVIVGGVNSWCHHLSNRVEKYPFSLRILKNVDDMPRLLTWADLAITAGGSTCWEMAFMGLPGLVISCADNQRPVAENLQSGGVALNLGWHEHLAVRQITQAVDRLLAEPETRRQLSRRGQKLVDGEGAARVVMQMRNEPFRLRRVRPEDCRAIWSLANDPEVRQASFSQEPIPWENHLLWFNRVSKDPGQLFFLAVDDQDVSVGQVRFELDNHRAIIHVSLAPNQRGRGYGRRIIDAGARQIFRQTETAVIDAFIKMDNVRSIRAFEAAGFKKAGVRIVRGRKTWHYSLNRLEIFSNVFNGKRNFP